MDTLARDSALLASLIGQYRSLAVLTGAGISLDSGIATYRDKAGNWLPDKPIDHRDFMSKPITRSYYWQRSWHGWPVIRDAQPNAGHRALTTLERLGILDHVITQNVDGLHQKAGSRRVIDLHGRVDQVLCLSCERAHDRHQVQLMMDSANDAETRGHGEPRPDGDLALTRNNPDFVPPLCTACGGDLKPDVVFFGGNVPVSRVQTCRDIVEGSDALLVVGSSLAVYSGYRFCRLAHRLGKPLFIINPGQTRADSIATRIFSVPAAPLLTLTLRHLA